MEYKFNELSGNTLILMSGQSVQRLSFDVEKSYSTNVGLAVSLTVNIRNILLIIAANGKIIIWNIVFF